MCCVCVFVFLIILLWIECFFFLLCFAVHILTSSILLTVLGDTRPKNGVLGDSPSLRITWGNLPRHYTNFNEIAFLYSKVLNKQVKKQGNPAHTDRILLVRHLLVNVLKALKSNLSSEN